MSFERRKSKTTKGEEADVSSRLNNAELSQGVNTSWIGLEEKIDILDHTEMGQEKTTRQTLPTEATVKAWEWPIGRYIAYVWIWMIIGYITYSMTGMTPEIMCYITYFMAGLTLTKGVGKPEIQKKGPPTRTNHRENKKKTQHPRATQTENIEGDKWKRQKNKS